MSRVAPAMPLFGDAYLADTRHLTLEEHGAYLQLLMIAWRTEGCCLPNDDPRLARMLGVSAGKWAKLKPTVMGFWECVDGMWRQRRLTKEHAFVEEKRAKNSASAKVRWEAKSPENIEDGGCERMSERNAPPPPPTLEEETEASPPMRASPQPVSEGVAIWNENAAAVGWPTVRAPNSNRTRALSSRLRENGLEGWRAALIRARASPYLGVDPPSWFTFDWVIKSTNFLKLIEGNYDRRRQSEQVGSLRGTRPDPSLDMLRDAAAELKAARGNSPPDRGAWPALPSGGSG